LANKKDPHKGGSSADVYIDDKTKVILLRMPRRIAEEDVKVVKAVKRMRVK
jgi:hypothetical protein